jgi:hypothetical protein
MADGLMVAILQSAVRIVFERSQLITNPEFDPLGVGRKSRYLPSTMV